MSGLAIEVVKKAVKVKQLKKSAKPLAAPKHLPFKILVKEALVNMKDRGGSSIVALRKAIFAKHGSSLGLNYKRSLSVRVKKLVKGGQLLFASNKYKLGKVAAPEKVKKPKKTTKKKIVLKKKVKVAKAKTNKSKAVGAKAKATNIAVKPKSLAAILPMNAGMGKALKGVKGVKVVNKTFVKPKSKSLNKASKPKSPKAAAKPKATKAVYQPKTSKPSTAQPIGVVKPDPVGVKMPVRKQAKVARSPQAKKIALPKKA